MKNPTETESEVVRKTCGYVYHDGSRTPASFQSFFAIDPRRFPQLFRITRTDLVVLTDRFRELDKLRGRQTQRNWASLGIPHR